MATADWFQTNLKIKFSDFNFHNPSTSEVPNRALFEDVRAIGRTNYESYVTPVFLENRRKPWRSTMKARAVHLSKYAARCLETQQNEIEWRLKVENDITDRFDTEVNCKRCRAVIWRAEKDPTIATNFKTPRRDCQCKPRDKDDNVDDGLSRIFDFHAGAEIEYDECIPLEHRQHPKPDRVYGLRKTDRISRLLEETLTSDGNLIGEKVKSTPYLGRDEKLLFPFFVSESKAERSASSRSCAQKQSACAIITCLELQAKLADLVRSTKSEDQSLEQKPLVWFLCNKGEQWYISVASFYLAGRSAIRYQVNTLWSGRITDPEDALRVLLIMDYVFDWARDVYRKNILDQLLALAANPTSTLAADTDMSTVAGGQYHNICRGFDSMEDQPHREHLDERGYSIPDLFEIFDTDLPTTAALRDARYMVHDVLGIDITPENFEELFQSLSEDSHRDSVLARRIQRAICAEHAWRISAETLDAIEFLWTGFDRDHRDFRDNDAKFLVNFAIASHLNEPMTSGRKTMSKESRWSQRHTLKFVAVAESAVELISSKSQYRAKNPIMDGLEVTKDDALRMFRKLRYGTVRQCLAAALSSVQRMTSRGDLKDSQEYFSRGKPTLTDVIKGHQTSELPIEVYHSLKTGRSEPDKSFLRLSSSPFQEQLVKENDAFSWLTGIKLISEEDNVVFAYATSESANKDQRQGQSHCIFVIDPTCTVAEPPSSHFSFNEMSAHHQEQTQQARPQQMSIFRVSTAPKVRRSLGAADGESSINAVSSPDFDWFVEHIQNEWSRLNQFIRCLEEGYYLSDFENLVKKIKLRYGPDQSAENVVQVLLGIGMSLKLRQLIKSLRDLTNGADLCRDEHSSKGKARAAGEHQSSVSTSTAGKRNAEEGELDTPGPSKRPRSSEISLRLSPNPPSSPSLRSCLTVQDEEEDQLVRLSLSSSWCV